jgi:hypothetical protein
VRDDCLNLHRGRPVRVVLAAEKIEAFKVGSIHRDEVRHYKHFYRYFNKYNAIEHHNHATVLGTLVRRRREILPSDAECGLWHPFDAQHKRASRKGREFRRAVARTTALVRRSYPTPMAIKMFLKPLASPPAVDHLSYAPAKLAQRLIMR